MSELAIERLQESIPIVAEQIGELATVYTIGHDLRDELKSTEDKLHSLTKDNRKKEDEIDGLTRDIIRQVLDDGSTDDLDKVALVGSLDVATQSSMALRSKRLPAEKVFAKWQKEFMSIRSSINGLRRLAEKPDQPLLYCEVHGGPSYVGLRGLEEHPYAQHFFTAKTAGTGLSIEINPTTPRLLVEFDIKDKSATRIGNFVVGSQTTNGENDRLSIRRPEQIAATAHRASTILKQGVIDMQINPIFVGEKACDTATDFLQEHMARVSCDIPGLVEITEEQINFTRVSDLA